MSEPLMRAAARVSWFVPTAALVVVGLHDSLPPTAVSTMLTAATVSAAIGLVIGAVVLVVIRRAPSPSVRANALAGVLAGAAVLVVKAAAGASGSAAMREAQRSLEGTTAAALRDTPGWNGGAVLGTTSIVASSLDRRSQASKVMTHAFGRPLRVVVLFVDNRAGDHEVVVDLEKARARLAGGAMRASLSREDLVPDLTGSEDRLARTIHVPAGERFDRAQVFFAEDVNFRDVEAVELHVDGAPLVVQGRYFTVEEKRAIDSARAR